MPQIAKELDQITKNKIVKGAFFSFLAAGSLASLQYIGTVHISNPLLASFVTFFVPFAVNAVNEFFSGVPKSIQPPVPPQGGAGV